MSKILFVLATIDTPQPDSQTFGGTYLFSVDGAGAIESTAQHTSGDLVDGDHTCTCQALDTTNTPMGSPVSLTITLAAGTIVVPGAPVPPPTPATFPAPASLSASVVA